MSDPKSNHPDIAQRAGKAAQRQTRAAKAAERRKRVERAGYTISEFSTSLGIDDSTTFRWIKRGLVGAIQIGGLTIIPAVERDRLMAEGAPLRRGRQPRAAGGQFVKKAAR